MPCSVCRRVVEPMLSVWGAPPVGAAARGGGEPALVACLWLVDPSALVGAARRRAVGGQRPVGGQVLAVSR